MNKSDINKPVIFFAYQGQRDGQSDENVAAIIEGIKLYNDYQQGYVAKAWEEYKEIRVISKKILDAIRACEVFACDLTYFNHNVLFELGYAIASDRKIIIFINKKRNEAPYKYSISIYKDLEYVPLTNGVSIQAALQNKLWDNILGSLVNIRNIDKDSIDLFYLQSIWPNQYSQDLDKEISKIEKDSNVLIERDSRGEDNNKPMPYYFQKAVKAKSVLIHFLGKTIENESVENGKNSFYAGVACGLGKDTLLVAPALYDPPPLDYHEIFQQYSTSESLVRIVNEWLIEKIKPISPRRDATRVMHEINLIKLGLGPDAAENEGEKLLNYFIETAAYDKAFNSPKSIIIGRKGSGKTAIYIKLINELTKDKNNYVIVLKPEPDELEENSQVSKLYKPASVKSFYYAAWKLNIFSKMMLMIAEKILEKPSAAGNTPIEEDIIDYVEKNENLLALHFFGVINEISKKAKDDPSILETLHHQYLAPMTKIIREYFRSKNMKYVKIYVVADNLDKTWGPQYDKDVQSEMIWALWEIENVIQDALIDRKGEKVSFGQIIFLRKDIYDYIKNNYNEPDKIAALTQEIDWETYPALLRQLIENRFKYILGLSEESSIENVWRDYFDFSAKQHPFDLIVSIITKRPRDIINFITRLFESAVNNGHSKANDNDLNNAINEYSNYLNDTLITETIAEYPEIREILAQLQKRGTKVSYNEFVRIIKEIGYDKRKIDTLIEALFAKEYLVGYGDDDKMPFNDMNTLKEKSNKRKWMIFPINIYFITHAKAFFIRQKKYSSF